MCKSLVELNNIKKIVGYKFVVTDKYGHHYSAYTGIRYQPGPVPKLKKIGKYSSYNDAERSILYGFVHNELQHEKRLTGVFKDIESAILDLYLFSNWNHKHLRTGSKYNIVKMTLSGDIYNGIYDGNEIQLGNHIDSIELIKNAVHNI